MSKREQILVLNPASEIKFKGPYTEVVTRTLTLTNPSEQKVAFKIKTTTPKRYCVRPNSGTLNPGETVSVSIMLQPYDQETDKTKHKFMVQSIFINNKLSMGPIDNYWKTISADTVMDTKLKCVFEEDDSPKVATAVSASGEAGLLKELQELRSENKRLKNEGLRYRNMALDQSFTTASSLTSLANSGTPLAQKEINYKNILVGILVALFAVLLVKWLF